MKNIAIVTAVAVMFCSFAATAKTFPIPADDPIATVTIPDAWEPETYEEGVEATSPDKAIYVAMEKVQADDVASATEEGLKYFIKQGIELNLDSKQLKDTKINGLDAFDVTFNGKDKDGDANVILTLVQTNAKDSFLLLYYWGSAAGEKANL